MIRSCLKPEIKCPERVMWSVNLISYLQLLDILLQTARTTFLIHVRDQASLVNLAMPLSLAFYWLRRSTTFQIELKVRCAYANSFSDLKNTFSLFINNLNNQPGTLADFFLITFHAQESFTIVTTILLELIECLDHRTQQTCPQITQITWNTFNWHLQISAYILRFLKWISDVVVKSFYNIT